MEKSRTSSNLIIVSGLAATGKTFIAKQIADYLQLPLISKDKIKELLYDSLLLSELYDTRWSRKLTAASMLLMYQYAEIEICLNRSCIIESTFNPEFSTPDILGMRQRCSFNPIQILCYAEGSVVVERFKNRVQSGLRHPAHPDALALNDPMYMAKLASGRDEILDIGGQIIEVNTTNFEKINLAALTAKLSEFLGIEREYDQAHGSSE